MKVYLLTATLAVAALLCCGCASNAASIVNTEPYTEPYIEITPAPTPEPTVAPYTEAGLLALGNTVKTSFHPDFSSVIFKKSKLLYAGEVESIGAYTQVEGILHAAAESAAATAGVAPGRVKLPSSFMWKEIAALYTSLGDSLAGALAESVQVEVSLDGGALSCTFTWPAFWTIPKESVGRMSAKMCFAYLATIYDAEGKEISYQKYVFDGGYLDTVAYPLKKYQRNLKDTWYRARDRGTRKHTGTDIKVPANTEIVSCTDGTVLYIGYNDTAGNYVAVMDAAGFEYHYYHMIRKTDFLNEGDTVKQGDLLGHVGSTGNSVANHLHLTVISPECTFINPYDMLKEVLKRGY